MKNSRFTQYIKFIFLVVTLVVASSCATLFNKPYKTVSINVDTPCKLVIEKDTFAIKQEEKIKFARKNGGITFTTIALDSVKNDYFIPSKVSSTIYWNIPVLGITGIIVDLFSRKKFSYPHYINLTPGAKSTKYTTYRTTQKGDIFFNVSIPLFNVIEVNMPLTGSNLQGNMLGFGLGLDYYHTNNQFVNLSGTSINDFFTLKETNLDDTYSFTDIRSNYLSITNNHKIKNISLGYGLSYSRNQYLDDYDTYLPVIDSTTKIIPYNKKNSTSEVTQNVGLFFTLKIQAGKYLYASFNYRPSIIQLGRIDPYVYEHYTGFELCYKFKANKQKEKSSNHQPGFFERNFGHLK